MAKPENIRRFGEDNIPKLFVDKYSIFKFMDEENKLDKESDFELYTELLNELKQEKQEDIDNIYIPHNVHYLEEKDKEKFLKLMDNKSTTLMEPSGIQGS